MNNFTIFPAIDLHAGNVVRLRQGDRNQMTNFNLQPEAAAEKWIHHGAKWLHIVNLDGAFGEDTTNNLYALKQIIAISNGCASLQYGGGLRDLASIDHILSLGVSRVVIGTAAVKNPTLLQNALKTFGSEKIILGVDARDGWVRVSGWDEKTEMTPTDLIQKFVDNGLETIIYTNIERDGMESGVDINATMSLKKANDVDIIASGGVAHLKDIMAVKKAGFAGVIIGKALYNNNFSLSEALSC